MLSSTHRSLKRPMVALVACAGVAAMIVACSPDSPTGVRDMDASGNVLVFPGHGSARVEVCHRSHSGSRILDVDQNSVEQYLSHGDYLTTLRVSHDAGQPSDGAHFRRMTDALDAARAGRIARGELTSAGCRITIQVSADTYEGTTSGAATGDVEIFPLVVDVPRITIRGALAMGLDVHARATGVGADGVETTLNPAEPLPVIAGASTPIIVANAHPGGSAGNGLVVSGFVFKSGHDPLVDAGGQGLLSVRVTSLTVRGNRFEGGFTESIDIRGGSAEVVQNHLSGTAGTCDVCLSGPGHFSAVGNRLLAGGIPGIVASGVTSLPTPSGVEPTDLPATAETWALIWNNEVRDHLRLPVGTGLRVDALGVGAPNVHNTVHAVILNNSLVNNRFGLIVHASFTVAGTDRESDVDVTVAGNSIEESCQARLLVSLSRHQSALGLKQFPYLLNSTFRIALHHNLNWDEAWYSNPDGYGNTLIVDGKTIPYGGRQFYSATGCPGLE